MFLAVTVSYLQGGEREIGILGFLQFGIGILLHRSVFILHRVVKFLLIAQFPLNFLFLGITTQSSVLTARDYWNIEIDL